MSHTNKEKIIGSFDCKCFDKPVKVEYEHLSISNKRTSQGGKFGGVNVNHLCLESETCTETNCFCKGGDQKNLQV